MHRSSLTALTIAGVLLVGCSSSTSAPAGATPGTTSMSFATGGTTSATTSAALSTGPSVSQSVKVTTSGDSIQIDSAFVVLRKIELEGVDTSKGGCPDDGAPRSGAECGEIHLGPVLVSLPLKDSSIVQTFSTAIPNGTYGRVEFRIHTPTRSRDTSFVAANPGYDSTSVRVVGTFDGRPFVFTSPVSAKYEADLVPPLVVTDTSAHNLTIKVDVATWFKTSSGSLIDPATAARGTSNAQLVAYNIRKSFRSLKDDNHRGRDDNGRDGSGRDSDGN